MTAAIGLGLASATAPGHGAAWAGQAPDSSPATPLTLSPGVPAPPVVDQDDAEFRASFDPRLRMVGPVLVEGRGPYGFVVDTGANRSAISAELARELDLRPGGEISLHGIAGEERVPTAYVRRFEVAEMVTPDLRMPVLPRRRLGADGLLGLDALGGRMVELDFRRQRVRLGRSRVRTAGSSRLTPDSRQPGAVIPAKYRFGQLTIVLARAGNAPVTAFIDSGSQATVGNTALRRAVNTRKLAVPGTSRVVPIFSVTSQVAYGEYEVLKLLSFGGDARLRNLPVVFSDLHTFDLWGLRDTPALLIGADTLSAFSQVTLDFGRREVVLNP